MQLDASREVSVCPLSTLEPRWAVTVDDADRVAITGDGKHVLVGDKNGVVRMLDGATGKLQWKQKVLQKFVGDLAFSPGGRYFAVGGDDRFVFVFDTRTRSVIARLAHAAPTRDSYGGILALEFAPDDKSIATGGADDTLRVFSLPTAKLQLELTANTQALAWAPDGATLAYATSATINFANVANGSVVQLRTDHTLEITALAYSPDGKLVASGSRDKTIRLWNAAPRGRNP